MTILERIRDTKEIWQMAMPWCPLPADEFLLMWVTRFSDDIIAYSISRTRRKFHETQLQNLTPEDLQRYCTGVMVSRTARLKEQAL